MSDDLRVFDTGAVRNRDGDAYAFHLISPIALFEIAKTCREGADAYADHNWEKGMPVADLLNRAIRHIYAYLAGDDSEPHLAHAAWGVMAAIHSEKAWPELNKGRRRSAGCLIGPDVCKRDDAMMEVKRNGVRKP